MSKNIVKSNDSNKTQKQKIYKKGFVPFCIISITVLALCIFMGITNGAEECVIVLSIISIILSLWSYFGNQYADEEKEQQLLEYNSHIEELKETISLLGSLYEKLCSFELRLNNLKFSENLSEGEKERQKEELAFELNVFCSMELELIIPDSSTNIDQGLKRLKDRLKEETENVIKLLTSKNRRLKSTNLFFFPKSFSEIIQIRNKIQSELIGVKSTARI